MFYGYNRTTRLKITDHFGDTNKLICLCVIRSADPAKFQLFFHQSRKSQICTTIINTHRCCCFFHFLTIFRCFRGCNSTGYDYLHCALLHVFRLVVPTGHRCSLWCIQPTKHWKRCFIVLLPLKHALKSSGTV